MSRIYAISDIHGNYELFVQLLHLIPFNNKKDKIILLGDYIDRGPKSKDVIDLIIKLCEINNTEEHTAIVPLKGNHEMMIDACELEHPDARPFWYRNGGMETLKSYGYKNDYDNFKDLIGEKHFNFIKRLPIVHQEKKHIFVHAGLIPGKKIEEHDFNSNCIDNECLWIRETFIYSLFDWGKIVVFGHTPQKTAKPLFMSNKICVDTGANWYGVLTAVEVLNKEVYYARDRRCNV